MPHVQINCYPGRSEELKKNCADKVAATVAETLGCNISSVSVAIKEVEQSDWKDFYNNTIMGDKDALYVEPGYEV
ncbi:MAG: tautomerase family protein [Clostridiales bacterium]|nr:tautomerase family protein [Clostridiales bacterium]